MNKKKGKMIKSGVSLLATALVLIVVTVAWFSSGSKVGVDSISAQVDSEGFTYLLYEAIDANKTGGPVPPTGLTWVAVSDLAINVNNAVPNQYRYFKATITSGIRSEIKVKFAGIEVTSPVPAARADFLSLIDVHFRTEDNLAQPMPGGAAVNNSMYELLGNPAQGDPIPQEVQIYNIDVSTYQNATFDIYYTIGVDKAFKPKQNFLGAFVDIGTLVFE